MTDPTTRRTLWGVTRTRGRQPWLAAALLAAVAVGCSPAPAPLPTVTTSTGPGATVASPSPPPTPVPTPGHELYGFIPYWEMDDTIDAHLAATPLTTVALFSVTTTSTGAIDETKPGAKLITGATGSALVATAHRAGMRVDLVYGSFGAAKNRTFFRKVALQDAAISSLVALAGTLGLDGVNLDVEGIDAAQVPAYADFAARLRAALVAADAGDRLTVSTGAGPTGALMASAALAAGADRAFLMGYDYRTASSTPGATSPLARTDGGRTLPWSLDAYATAGVPVTRLLLGLPLYGVRWPVAGAVLGAPSTGDGVVWVLRKHVDVLGNPSVVPVVDDLEGVDVYFFGSDGSVGAPLFDPAASPDASMTPFTASWTAAYADSPDTLARKLGLAESRGLAGAGFWAIGYERGLPAYTDLMRRFVGGQVPAQAAPGS